MKRREDDVNFVILDLERIIIKD